MRGHFQCLAVVASFERRALSMLSGNVMAQHNIAQGRKMQCACVIGGFVFKPCLCVLHSLGLFRPLMCTNKVSSWTAPFGQGPRALPLTCVTAAHGGLHRGFTRVPPAHANETPNVSKHQQSQLCASPSSSRNWRLDPSFSVGPLVGLGLDRIHEWQPHPSRSAKRSLPAARAAAGARVAGQCLWAGKACGAPLARVWPLARVPPQVGDDALLGREARLAHGAVVPPLARVRHLVAPHPVPVRGRVRAPAALPHSSRQLPPAGCHWKPTDAFLSHHPQLEILLPCDTSPP